jgi:hypothetical protein
MMTAGRADLSKSLVPDELRELVAPLLPWFAARPRGGWTAPPDEQAVFTAVVYVLTSGCGLAASAADVLHVLHVLRHCTSPPHGMDRGLPVASAASGGAGRTRGPRICTSVSPSSRSSSASPPSGRRGPRRRRPVQLRAVKAYFSTEHLSWLCAPVCSPRPRGRETWTAVDSTIVRAHRHAAGPAKRRGATVGESEARAVGRSRGGLPTKVHMAADGRCRPLALVLTPGQTGDAPAFEYVMAALRVPRRRGRPRTRPMLVLAGDKIEKPDRSANERRRSAGVGLRGREPSV